MIDPNRIKEITKAYKADLKKSDTTGVYSGSVDKAAGTKTVTKEQAKEITRSSMSTANKVTDMRLRALSKLKRNIPVKQEVRLDDPNYDYDTAANVSIQRDNAYRNYTKIIGEITPLMQAFPAFYIDKLKDIYSRADAARKDYRYWDGLNQEFDKMRKSSQLQSTVDAQKQGLSDALTKAQKEYYDAQEKGNTLINSNPALYEQYKPEIEKKKVAYETAKAQYDSLVTEQNQRQAQEWTMRSDAKQKAYESVKYFDDYNAYVEKGSQVAGLLFKVGLIPQQQLQLTDDQAKTIAYYVGKGDEGQARAYVNEIKRGLDEKVVEVNNAWLKKFAQDNGAVGQVISGIATVPYSVFNAGGLIETTAQAIDNVFSGDWDKPVNTNSQLAAPVKYNKQLRESALEGLGDTEKNLADVILSIGQSAITFPLGPTASLAIMSSSAGGSKAIEAAERGATALQASFVGYSAALAEYLTEKLPIENLFKFAKEGAKGFGNYLKKVVKQTFTEASEEGLSEWMNLASDMIIMGENSEFAQYRNQLMKAGLSYGEASNRAVMKFVVEQPIMSMVGGAISGAAMSSVALGIGTYKNYKAAKNANINNDTNTDVNASVDTNTPSIQVPQDVLNQRNMRAKTYLPVDTTEAETFNKIANSDYKFTHNTDGNLKTFDEQLEGYQNKTMPTSASFALGETPVLWQEKLDINNNPVVMTQGTLRKIMEKHGLSLDEIEPLPSELNDPVMILQSKNPANSIVVITDITNSIGQDVIAAVHLDINRNAQIVNDIASVYGKENIERFIETASDENRVLYINNEKALQKSYSKGLQLPKLSIPESSSGIAPNNIISDTTNVDNQNTKNISLRPDVKHEIPKKERQVIPNKNSVNKSDVSDDVQISQFIDSMRDNPNLPETMSDSFEKSVQDGTGAYVVAHDKASQIKAQNVIGRKGFTGAMQQWQTIADGRAIPTKDDIVLGETLLTEAMNSGDTATAMKLVADLSIQATRAGQNVQAFSLLKKLTPQGKLYYLERFVQNQNQILENKLGTKYTEVTIPSELKEALLKSTTMSEMQKIEGDIIAEVAAQIPSTLAEKINAWRYMSMLGNPRTHIRNIVGNTIMDLMRRTKNTIGAVIESAANLDTRTKTLKKSSAETKSFAKEDASNMKDVLQAGGKYGFNEMLNKNKKTFESKALNAVNDFNNRMLEAEDGYFLTRAYSDTLSQYMTANDLTAEYLQSGTKEANLEFAKARKYAVQEALKATFRDANALATWLNKVENANAFSKVVMGGIVPFKKTPGNIVKRALEYSPVGLIDSITHGAYQLKKGEANGGINANQFIDKLSSGLTGTGIVALGAFLRSLGVLNGKDEDKDKSSFLNMLGAQDYSINIGGASYTFDWAVPVSIPLFVGATIQDLISGQGGWLKTPANIINGIYKTLDPVVNLSMLQGIDRALSGYEAGFDSAILNTIEGYAGQFVPTIGGQIARTIDPTRRTTYAPSDSVVTKRVETFARRMANKIPGLSMLMEPYVDQWGRTETKESVMDYVVSALENFVSPGYIGKSNITPVDEELTVLYGKTQDSSVLPKTPQSRVTINGETSILSASEYTKIKTTYGQTAYNLASELIKSDTYKNMTDKEKTEAFNKIYNYALQIAKGEYATDKKLKYEPDPIISKAQGGKSAGVSESDYIAYSIMQDSFVSDKDASGQTIEGSKQAKVRDWLLKSNYTEKQRQYLYSMDYSGDINAYAKAKSTLPKYSKFAALSADDQNSVLDSVSKYYVNPTHLDNAKAHAAELSGIDVGEYYTFEKAISKLNAKDENGKTVNNLKKQRTLDYVNSLSIPRAKKGIVLCLSGLKLTNEGGGKKLLKDTETYIKFLNITDAEKKMLINMIWKNN